MSEFGKKWSNTCIYISKDNLEDPILCQLVKLNDDMEGDSSHADGLTIRVRLYIDGKWSGITQIRLYEYIIDTSILEVGYINYGTTCGYRTRLHRKQWNRGSSDTTLGIDIYRGDIEQGFEFSKYILDTNLCSISSAIEQVLTGKYLARAFTSSYAIGLHKHINRLVLLYKNKYIGIVDQLEDQSYMFRLPKTNKHFIEEVSQYLPTVIGE
jgi:hypothetical protein